MDKEKVMFCLYVLLAIPHLGLGKVHNADHATNTDSIHQLLTKMQKQLDSQQQEIAKLQQDLEYKDKQYEHFQKEFIAYKNEMSIKIDSINEGKQHDTQYVNNVVGCIMDDITLSCPIGKQINVSYAKYGMYTNPCHDDCCVPYPLDCTENVFEMDLPDWLALKFTCDNTSSCTYLFDGAIINACEEGYSADYMQISYDCLPEAVDFPIGFTASTTVYRTYYAGDVVIFDNVLTNYGNGYNPHTNYFTCPRHGIYIFGGTIFTANDIVVLDLMMEDVDLIQVYVEDFDGNHISSSFHIIVECEKGQVVWIRAPDTCYVFSDNSTQTHFYGSFLQNA